MGGSIFVLGRCVFGDGVMVIKEGRNGSGQTHIFKMGRIGG